MGMEVVGGTFQPFPSGRFFGEFQPLRGEHGSFHQSYMADVGLAGQLLQCITVIVRRWITGMEQTAQYSPFGVAPVVTVADESVFAERLQDADQCFRSVDTVQFFSQAGDLGFGVSPLQLYFQNPVHYLLCQRMEERMTTVVQCRSHIFDACGGN